VLYQLASCNDGTRGLCLQGGRVTAGGQYLSLSPARSRTGTLTGVTGVDGEFTIRAHTDNKLYFENRTGAALSFSIAVVARHV
jgi:hypothetical protein